MPISDFKAIRLATESLIAQKMMSDIISSGFFELKKDKRRQIWDDLKKKANAARPRSKEPVSMAEVLKGLGVNGG